MSHLKFKIGDKVTFTNSYGVVFPGHKITGYCETNHVLYQYGARYYIDTDSYWYPVAEDTLTAEPA